MFTPTALEGLGVACWRQLRSACIVLASPADSVALSDICRISVMSGAPPVINLADDCSVDYAVEAMSMGAYSVLESNADDAGLRAEIVSALVDDQASRELRMSVAEWQELSQQLTEAERHVLAADWDGRLPEATARELRIDVPAVRELTARTYQKLGVRSRAESVRMLARVSVSSLALARALR